MSSKPQLRRFNRYQDVEIDASLLPHDELGKFLAALAEEEGKWLSRLNHRMNDVRQRQNALFWVKVHVRLCHLLPSLLGSGVFQVHHATPEYIMLVKGPGDSISSSIPLYGTHYARVECVVLDGITGNVLTIRECIGVMSCSQKLVTGSVESGEYISVAAEREVLEETGIVAQFVGVIGVVNRLSTRFMRDEILIGCLLYANPSGQVPRPMSDEIRHAEWTPANNLITQNGNYMTKRWLVSLANMSIPSLSAFSGQTSVSAGYNGVLPGRPMDDFRGHGHIMMMYSHL